MRVINLIAVLFLFSGIATSQTFVLQPATSENADGDFITKLLLKKDQVFRLDWSTQVGSNAKLIIGRSANTYTSLEVDVSGQRGELIPNEIGLGAGRYYARITNSSARTTSGIQADQQSNPGSIIYSNEILLLVEADEAPSITAPRGAITNATPTFQWSAVSGVPSYWLIVSSTPFDIVEDESDNISIEGATIVWQYITRSTTAEYGDINRESPFTDEAPPLNAGQEYSYTVLNVYEENNPVYTSPVFGGIVPFTFQDPNAVPATNLRNPSPDEVFVSEETIAFEWSRVPEATNYTINLLQIVKQQGIDVTVPIWTSTTTNTLIEYPAIENLKNGTYQWNVISNKSNGGGSTSQSRFFRYQVETGEFAASIESSADNSSLLGVELSARAVSGGVTPTIPYFVQNETHFDSLVAGTYEFIAVKTGYEDATRRVEIRDGATTRFTMQMDPLPSSVKGFVEDENGNNIEDAVIQIRNQGTGITKQVSTDVNGEFSGSLNQGSYVVTVSKSGYISPSSRSITLDLNEQREISSPFVLTNDQATVSGTVFNDQGSPVQRATVRITKGNNSYETKSNGSGVYQFTVASGTWTLSVQKVGFVTPAAQNVSLSTGDIAQGQDFILTGNANQITGFVRERITNEDGTTGSAPFSGIEVTAVPNVGSPITTTSETNGQYTLSLRSGSYTIQATENNYTSTQDRELVIGIAVGETISGMDFELIPNPSSVSGIVSLPNGNGVADANVSIPGVGSTITSASGFYSLSVPEGSHTISVSKAGLVSPSPRTVTINVGQNLTGVNYEMTPNAGSISGRVSSGGEPLSNTILYAINTVNNSRTQITNNLNGTYSFNLSSGSWYIKAVKSGFISDSTSVLNVGPGQQLVNKNFSLQQNLTTIRGTVTDGVNPVRNATITITRASGGNFNQTTVTQINGTYAFTLPAGVAYQITASKDGYRSSASTTSVLVAGSTVARDFELAANPSSVAGTIRVTGQSVLSNAKIVAVNSEGARVDSTTSRTNGTYLLGLTPDSYTLRVTKSGYTTKTTSTVLSIGQNLTGINFSLDENFAFFSGNISSSDDNGLEQVFVNLVRSGGGGASAVTNQDGVFSISGLIGGSYRIELSKSGYVSKTITRSPVDGAFVNIEEALVPKNGSITGVIRDENGAIVSDATVTATSSSGSQYTTISQTDGTYSLNALEIETYTINAAKTGFTTADGTTSSISEANLNRTGINVTDLIPNNAQIEVTITNNSTGNGIKDVQVSAAGSRGSGYGLTSSTGKVTLSNLIPGSYELISSKQGFKSDTTTINIDPSSPQVSINRSLIQNNGKITGVVTDPNGGALPFRPTVTASTGSSVLTTQTDNTGAFSFEGVETGIQYTIATDIYRDGYENVEEELFVPRGAAVTSLPDELEVTVQRSSVSGSAGVADATLKLLDANTNEIIEIGSSAADQSYLFDFLGAGNYKLLPQRLGYTFTPEMSDVISLGIETARTVNFTAQANIATLDVIVNNSEGNGVSNVDVTIISEDTTVVLSEKTGPGGIARFSKIKASTYYIVRPVKEGFTASPNSKEITLNTGDSLSTEFLLTANDAAITGLVQSVSDGSASNLRDATVVAVYTSTGQSFETTTNNSGVYTLEGIAPGSYDLFFSKTGFTTDTVSVEAVAGQTASAETGRLLQASVRIQGYVFLKGSGMEGVEVTALSTASYTAITNSDGRYRFDNLPVKTGINDTTVYQIQINSGIFSKSFIVEITADQVGGTIRVDDTVLPSGKIELYVTDGAEPVSGAELIFGISGGEAVTVITGNDGAFESSENLRKATYSVSVAKQGYLFPQNTIRIDLPSDTSLIERSIFLPYTQLEVSEILADESTQIDVVNQPGYDNSGAEGTLYYKRASESQFTPVEMQRIGDTLRAAMPATFSVEDLSFYTSITDSERNNTYISSEQTITPLASGILSTIRVTPAVNGQTLRKGDTYNIELFVRDGVNKSLQSSFQGDTAAGTIEWSVLSDNSGISLSDQNGTAIQLNAEEEGTWQIQVDVNLEGSFISQVIQVDVSEVPLEQISVSVPGTRISNSTTHLFSYSAVDTSGRSVILGTGLKWAIVPVSSGSIDSRGLFTPSGTNIFGTFNAEVYDGVSEITGVSDAVELTARVEPASSYELTNGEGLVLSLSEGSVDIPSQVSLGKTNPPSTKKFVFAQGTDQSYTVADNVYILSFAGSELKKSAQLTLPEDSTLELHTGQREIARFNFTTLQWELLENAPAKRKAIAAATVSTSRLGQFAVLAENEPLGINYAAVLPSPFSPDIAPVKIGYWLDTAFPPAKVNVRIYNIRGELVRNLIEDELQQPGRYGSSSSEREIIWDGLTDNGNMARNGRYVIEIKAKDQQDEVVKLLQVILIK